MSPKVAGRKCRHVQGLCRLGLVSVHTAWAFQTMMWGPWRKAFSDIAAVSYVALAAAAGMSPTTVKVAISRLIALGVISKRNRSIQVPWFRGTRWVQIANEYTLLPPPDCEASGRPTLGEEEKKKGGRRALKRLLDKRFPPSAPALSVAEQLAVLNGTA